MPKRSPFIVVCFCVIACARPQAFTLDNAAPVDDSAELALPDAPVPTILASDPQRTALPYDQGQTTPAAVDTTTGVPQREATWHSLPGDFLHDQKDLWTFPWQLAKGRHWLPTLIVVGGTVGLIFADPEDTPYFRNHQQNWDDVNDVFDPLITTGEVIALPAWLMTAGYIRHDDREVNTAILASEAYGDSAVINLAMKAVTRRIRPPMCSQAETSATRSSRVAIRR